MVLYFFFKQKTAYEMRISDCSSSVCSADLLTLRHAVPPTDLKSLGGRELLALWVERGWIWVEEDWIDRQHLASTWPTRYRIIGLAAAARVNNELYWPPAPGVTFNYERNGWRVNFLHDRSEEHTSELQSLLRNSYAALFLKKKNT